MRRSRRHGKARDGASPALAHNANFEIVMSETSMSMVMSDEVKNYLLVIHTILKL